MRAKIAKYLVMIALTMLFDLALSIFLLHHNLMEEGNGIYAVYMASLGITGLALQKIIMNSIAISILMLVWKLNIIQETRLEKYCAFAAWAQFGIFTGSVLAQIAVLMAPADSLLARLID